MHGVTLGSAGERAKAHRAHSVRRSTLMSGAYIGVHSMTLGSITISHCNVIANDGTALRSVLRWNVVIGDFACSFAGTMFYS
ncbi:MAG: hypothetical protein ACTS5F_01130 [Candidatus Hodgkinia cicadicola]